MRVTLPIDFKANVDASTNHGHITVALPTEARAKISKSEFHGVMNGGGPPVLVHTTDGSIDLNRL